jgi:hypothetical protein
MHRCPSVEAASPDPRDCAPPPHDPPDRGDARARKPEPHPPADHAAVERRRARAGVLRRAAAAGPAPSPPAFRLPPSASDMAAAAAKNQAAVAACTLAPHDATDLLRLVERAGRTLATAARRKHERDKPPNRDRVRIRRACGTPVAGPARRRGASQSPSQDDDPQNNGNNEIQWISNVGLHPCGETRNYGQVATTAATDCCGAVDRGGKFASNSAGGR